MPERWTVFHTYQLARYDEQPLTNVRMFVAEEFSGCVLGFLPGQELPVHVHEHEHEVFDVLQGRGTMYLDDETMELGPGDTAFVPAGVWHGFKNTSDDSSADVCAAGHPPGLPEAVEACPQVNPHATPDSLFH